MYSLLLSRNLWIVVGLLVGLSLQAQTKQTQPHAQPNTGAQQTKKIPRVPYFTFNTVDYYHFVKDRRRLLSIGIKKNPTPSEQGLYAWLTGKKVSDIDQLESLGYQKKTIYNTSKCEALRDIFSAYPCETSMDYGFIPEYLDILVFKNNGVTVGVAKVCLHTGLFFIAYDGHTTDQLSNCLEIDRLKKMLRSKGPTD